MTPVITYQPTTLNGQPDLRQDRELSYESNIHNRLV